MNTKKLLITVAAAGMLVCSTVSASDIYRYVDENGNISYGDRPTGEPTEQRMAMVSQPTNNAAVQERYNARYGQAAEETTEETPEVNGGIGDRLAEEEPMTRAQRVAAARERDAKCEKYRGQLETLVSARRLFRQDDNGERVYLEGDEVMQARAKAQDLITEHCE